MKFIISSRKLLSALQNVGRVISNKNTLPILDHFLFGLKGNTLKIAGADTENRLSTKLEVAEPEGEGLICIPSKLVLDALKELPDQPLIFDINDDNKEVFIYYHNGKYNFIGADANDYPQPKPLDTIVKKSVVIPSRTLLEGINGTVFAASSDELRPIMVGVLFDFTKDALFLVASDGSKLVKLELYNVKMEDKASFVLPTKGANLLKNLLIKEDSDVSINFDFNNAVIEIGDYVLTVRFIEGRYPNYESVIPKNNPNFFTIGSDILSGIIRRVSAFASKESSLVKFDLNSNALTVSAQDIDFSTASEESVEIDYTGIPMSIGFKSTYLIELLSAITTGDVKIELSEPSKAALLLPCINKDGIDSTGLLMPMMLNS